MVTTASVRGNGAVLEELDLESNSSAQVRPVPLSGLTVAVKDSYDIAGHRTGNGSPAWRDSHPAATANASAVDKLLAGGCRIVARCVMDEMAYSIEGQNHHYGTPLNPAYNDDRIPGGSSSGTASAVAQGLADIGLGGDTGGSVRVPAAFCGLFGIRPTHGRIDVRGSVPLSSAFDTVGLMTRDAALLETAAKVLLEGPSTPLPTPVRWLVGTDAFDMCSKDVATRLYGPLSAAMGELGEVLSAPVETTVCDDGSSLVDWVDVFRVCQGHEIWRTHGEWIRTVQPDLGPGIKERFEMASGITDEEYASMSSRRAAIAARLDKLLEGSVLMISTVSDEAPRKGLSGTELQQLRTRALALTSIAGLGGLPQVTIPLFPSDDAEGKGPLGISLIGSKGTHEGLLSIAVALSKRVPATDVEAGMGRVS